MHESRWIKIALFSKLHCDRHPKTRRAICQELSCRIVRVVRDNQTACFNRTARLKNRLYGISLLLALQPLRLLVMRALSNWGMVIVPPFRSLHGQFFRISASPPVIHRGRKNIRRCRRGRCFCWRRSSLEPRPEIPTAFWPEVALIANYYRFILPRRPVSVFSSLPRGSCDSPCRSRVVKESYASFLRLMVTAAGADALKSRSCRS